MKEYIYKVCLCDGHYCNGNIVVKADDEADAYNMVMDYVLGKLANALPELGIDVDIELKNCIDDDDLIEDLKMEQQEQM